jgi:hypothetical protein
MIQPAQIIRRNIAAEDIMPRGALALHNGLAADQAHLALGTGPAK